MTPKWADGCYGLVHSGADQRVIFQCPEPPTYVRNGALYCPLHADEIRAQEQAHIDWAQAHLDALRPIPQQTLGLDA